MSRAVVPAELPDPGVGYSAPRGQPGRSASRVNLSANLPVGLGKHHGVAPANQARGRFQACGPAPDDQDAASDARGLIRSGFSSRRHFLRP